jgi:hypothetical protein
MLGLAAAAALATMAFLGVSSAMGGATQLCTNDTGACVEPSALHFVSEGKAVLLNSFQQIECNVLIQTQHLKGLAVAGSGGQVDHVLTADLRFTNCEPCTTTTLSGGLLFFLRTGHEKATLVGTGFKIKQTCFLFFNCTYTFAALVGEVLGPLLSASGTTLLHYNKAPVSSESGGLCPPTTELDALFVSLDPIYLRE